MADSIIGALRVVLGADTAALEKGLKFANSQLSNFGSGVAKAAAGVAAAFVGMAGGIATAVKMTLNEADKLGKMAQSIGIPVEELSALKHAADLSGVSLEQLGKGVQRLSRAMIEAAATPTSQAAKAFQALGISVTDANGKVKSSSEVLAEVAGKFEGLEDGAGKTAIAMRLFGRAGADLIPLLNSGKTGLNAMIQEARDLGLVISTQTAKSAEAFNDNLTRLGKVADGIIIQFTAHMVPGLERLSAQLVQTAKDTDLVKIAANGLIGFFSGAINIIARLTLEFQLLGNTFNALKSLLSATTFSGLAEAWTNLKTVTAENATALRTFVQNQELAKVGADAFGVGLDGSTKAGERQKKTLDDLSFAAEGTRDAFKSFIDSTQKSILAQQAELATVGMATGAKEQLRIVTQGLAVAQQNGIAVSGAMRTTLEALGAQAANVALQLQGAQLVLEAREPGEKFRDEMERNRQALIAFGATAEQTAAVNRRTAESYGATWEVVSAQAVGGFAALAKEFGKQNKKIAELAKALGIVEALINTYVAFTKALASLPPPLNYVAAAGVLAAGLAKVAAIRSQNIPSAAMGGTFTVPGGMSATDNRFVPLNLAAGERVQITPADQAEKRQPPAQVNITVPNEMISREYMRKMFDQMNDMFRDGYTLKLAPAV